MTRRNLELVLLCLAAPIVLVLFASLVLNQGEDLTWQTLAVPIGLFGAFLIAHLATRKLAPGADPALLPIAFALSGIGITFITRIAPYTNTGSTNMAINQVVWLFLGVGIMILVMALFRNPDRLANYKYTLIVIGLALLLSPLIPGIGTEISGSRIWLSIGGFSFQPGELAKIFIALFLAAYLAQNREMLSVFTAKIGPVHVPDVRTLLPLLFMWGVAMLVIVFEKDLGSAVVLFFVFLIMLYVATGRKFYLVVGVLLIAAGGVAAYFLFDHVQTRVSIWLDPFADASGSGYQLVQTLYSLADGGLFGVGIGNGMAGGGNGLTQLSVVESDFIFACIGEEVGLLGASGVLLLYLCFAIRGFAVAARAKSDVSSLLAVGLTSVIALQAFIIVGGVTGLIPLTGITLPFISQGGSSLISSFIAVGFLMVCGNEGTGVEAEIATTTKLNADSVLGRVSLGKRLTGTIIVFALLFAALIANLTYIMVVKADYYQNLSSNSHTIVSQAYQQRGTISTSDGVVLAESVEQEDGTYVRVYPAGDLATHVVGYYSTIYGSTGIEAAYSDTLEGEENYATWADVLESLIGTGSNVNDVVLTIDSTVQQAAQDALEGYSGAVVVIDPTTGAILAMASSPTYDAADFAEVIEAANEEDSTDTSLLNRATMALYAPGSTFKIITLATAIEYGIATEDTVYEAPGTITIGGGTVSNYNGTSYGTITLARALEVSSNTVFGQLGVDIGSELLVAGAEAFLFDTDIDFDLGLLTSLMPDPDDMTEWETAWAAAGEPVGQEGPMVTVLQMALVACAIANDGVIMQPYLVEAIYNSEGVLATTTTPTVLTQAISADTANRVLEAMVGVVENGTGTAAAVDGVTVAGKTGTAENEDAEDNSWFVGIAPAGEDDEASVVVVIVIENGGSGTAARLAQNILEVALEVQGDL